MQTKLEQAKAEFDKPFPQEEEFQRLSLRAAEIAVQLDLDSNKNKQQDDQKDRRINFILTTEPQTSCQKKFFAFVKHTFNANDNDYSPENEAVAIKKLLEAGFSQKDISDTLFKFSPIISYKDDINRIVGSVNSQLIQSQNVSKIEFKPKVKVAVAASRSAGR